MRNEDGKEPKKRHCKNESCNWDIYRPVSYANEMTRVSVCLFKKKQSVYSFIDRLTFGDEALADFPREDGRILALVLLDLGDDRRSRHLGLGTADDARRTDRTGCHIHSFKK